MSGGGCVSEKSMSSLPVRYSGHDLHSCCLSVVDDLPLVPELDVVRTAQHDTGVPTEQTGGPRQVLLEIVQDRYDPVQPNAREQLRVLVLVIQQVVVLDVIRFEPE